MTNFEQRGKQLRTDAKSLVLDFMLSESDCSSGQRGMTQAEIFRSCGFSWGDYAKSTKSNQQYWVVALLRELQKEGKVEQLYDKGPWRLK